MIKYVTKKEVVHFSHATSQEHYTSCITKRGKLNYDYQFLQVWKSVKGYNVQHF